MARNTPTIERHIELSGALRDAEGAFNALLQPQSARYLTKKEKDAIERARDAAIRDVKLRLNRSMVTDFPGIGTECGAMYFGSEDERDKLLETMKTGLMGTREKIFTRFPAMRV